MRLGASRPADQDWAVIQRLWSVLTLCWIGLIASFHPPVDGDTLKLLLIPTVAPVGIWFAGRFILTGRWTAK